MPKTIPTSSQETTQKQSASILVLEPLQQGQTVEPFVLRPGIYRIGSASNCDIPIDAVGIAPQHGTFTITPQSTRFQADDQRTWLNNGPLKNSQLRAGDQLAIGPIEFRLRNAEQHELQQPKTTKQQPLEQQPNSDEIKNRLNDSIGMQPALQKAIETGILPPSTIHLLNSTTETNHPKEQKEQPVGKIETLCENIYQRLDKIQQEIDQQQNHLATLYTTDNSIEAEQPQHKTSPQQTELENLRQQIEAMQTAQKDEASRLQQKQQQLKDDFEFLQSRRTALTKAERDVEQKIKTNQQKWNSINEQTLTQTAENQQLIQEKTNWSEQKTRSEKQQRKQQQQIAELENQLANATTQAQTFSQQVADLQQATTQTVSTNNNAIISEQKINSEQKSKHNTLIKKHEQLTKEHSALLEKNQQTEQAQQKLTTRQKELDQQQLNIDEATKQVQQQTNEIERREQNLAVRQEEFEQESQKLQASRQQNDEEKNILSRTRADSQQQEESLQKQQTELEQQQAEFKKQQEQQQNTKHELNNQYDHLKNEHDTLNKQYNDIQKSYEQIQNEQQTLQDEQQQLTDQNEQLKNRIDELEREKNESQQPFIHTPPPNPQSTIPQTTHEQPKHEQPEEIQLTDIDDSNSVAAYMEQLLARAKQGTPATSHTSSTSKTAKTAQPKQPTPPITQPHHNQATTPNETEPNKTETAPIIEPSSPPKKREPIDKEAARADISSMRELANHSARKAIAKHTWKQLRLSVIVKFVLLIIAFTIGLIFTASSFWGTTFNPLNFSLGLIALLIAAIMGFGVLNSKKQVKSISQGIQTNSEETNSKENSNNTNTEISP